MKNLSFLFCLLPFGLLAQVIRIDSLPNQGLLLNQGWKWQADDSPNFAKTGFDDSQWERVDPTKDIHEYPQLFDSKVRWLRLTFYVTRPLPQPLGLSVNQATASEVYLNGKLIRKIGRISSDNIRAEDPLDLPFFIPIDSIGIYQLAVRLAVQPQIRYTRVYALTQNNVFNARLVDLVKTQNNQREFRVYYTGLEIFKIGMLAMLFILHLAFYLYQRSNITNLLLTFYFLGAFMQYVFKIIGQNHFSVEARYWYINLSAWSAVLGGLFAMWAFYRLSKTRFDIYFIIGLISNLIGALLTSSTYGMLWSILSFASAIINFLVILRLTRIGLKKKDKGFIILGVAVMLSSLGFVFIELLNQNVPISPYVVDVFFNLSAIAIPVGLSLYMGVEASERNKELQNRLTENEHLKLQSIAQEQEKRQILATQNETLERQVSERTEELVHKNHELEIEAALEKVRSGSLAMQKSTEVLKVAATLYEELQQLDFTFGITGINFIDEETGEMETWVAGFGQDNYPKSYNIPYFDHPFQKSMIEAWRNGDPYLVYQLTGAEKKDYDDFMFTQSDYQTMPEDVKARMIATESVTFSLAFMNYGVLLWGASIPLSEEKVQVLQRFAKVFEQAYTRFLDLQKAEAQAREAQIEAALEKIRSRSLAMHKSEELKEVIASVFGRLKELTLDFDAASIQLFSEGSKDWVLWVASPDVISDPLLINLPYDEDLLEHSEYFNTVWNALIRGEDIINRKYLLDEKNKYYNYVIKYNPQIPPNIAEMMLQVPGYTHTVIIEKNSALIANSWYEKTLSVNDYTILKRVAIVFEQAYTRFLDLQKAEAQARASQIEAALERVRSRTMAMYKSEELSEVASLLFEQLTKLGVTLWISGFCICKKDSEFVEHFISPPDGTMLEPMLVPFSIEKYNQNAYKAWLKGTDIYIDYMEGEEMQKGNAELLAHPSMQPALNFMIKHNISSPNWVQRIAAIFKYGYVMIVTTEPFEETQIFVRFAKVFEQSYTRFLDLQKAETQAREAQIQLALERVRARTMAMQKSEELGEAASIMFHQLKALGFSLWATTVDIWKPGDQVAIEYAAGPDGKFREPFKNPIDTEDPIAKKAIEQWNSGTALIEIIYSGEALVEGNKKFSAHPETRETAESLLRAGYKFPEFQVNHFAVFSHGFLQFITTERYPDDHNIFTRFAKVFEQTYTRFVDLQKAELQAREAQIEASLERIRSRVMAMDTSEELTTLIGFIYAECTKLNMLLDRGFIMTFDKETKDAHWWMVSADASDMPLKILVRYHEYAPNLAILKGWEEREQRWSYALEGDNKKTWDDYQFANDLSQLPDFVKDNMRSVKSVILNASFQNFGCIMLSSFEPLSEDHFDLLMRLSKVVDLTYTRFLDLQLKEQNAIRLTEEKQKLEFTLSELRTTQAQLIQSEKLASLGELTAGIAHEIQNPLNFVNNFSELSVDLINEVNEEMKNEFIDKNYMSELLGDLSQNQEKINHHGKRASSIVKGMLEHSRTRTGVKESTDMNKLADEYIRLSYHGIRAKDSSFNSDYELITDEELPNIEVVPQEIGRVLLNLINNAFYAVNTRAKQGEAKYQPKVTVTTQVADNRVEIRVADNGTGIPEGLKSKIFQPFFTTKPTGEGTGLGLSLAYDIVTKGHGGTLEVESVEGEGTTFIIRLSI